MENKKLSLLVGVVLIALAICFVMPFGGIAKAATADLLDQEQTNRTGNVWVNFDFPRYQTFTPSYSGHLSKIDIDIFASFGMPGALKVSIYKEGDLTKPLASTQLATYNSGWTSIDFSEELPYLTRETKYRMVVSTEVGGSSYGFGWYTNSHDEYIRGESAAFGGDFTFKTYMIPDYSLSPLESQLSIHNTSLVADGTSQTTVMVQLKNAQGNAITLGGERVSIASTLGTISAVTDNNNGTYSAIITAPTTIGTGIISASVGGRAIPTTTSVQFVPGAPSTGKSTINVNNSSLLADGTSQTTVTVKLKDAQGHNLTTGGAVVDIITSQGTMSAVTDHSNGSYTAMLTAPISAGTSIISAKVGGNAMAATTSVQFIPLPAQTVSAIVASSIPPAGSDNIVTLTVKNALGNTDTTFNGMKNVTISGANQAPDGSFGSFNGVPLTSSQVVTLNFTKGVATASLKLNGATTHTIQLIVAGVNNASANSLILMPVAGSAITMKVTTDIQSPTMNAGIFSQQPVVTLFDAFGNVSVKDSTTVITVSKKDTGAWTLTGTLKAQANKGIVRFLDLGAMNLATIADAQLSFNASGLEPITSVDVPLMAKQLAVHFDDGSTVSDLIASYGDKLIAPNIPTKAGHTFVGWYKDADLTTKWDFATEIVTSDITLYGKWTINNYTVTYNANGGTPVATATVPYNEKATAPIAPTKAGHTFVGWFKDADLTTKWDFTLDIVTNEIILYGKWLVISSSGNESLPTNPSVPEKPLPEPSVPDYPTPEEPGPSKPDIEPEFIFSDVPKTHWAWDMIQEMTRKEIITGYSDKSFRPNENIKRQHIAVLFARALTLEPIRETVSFHDVVPSHPYYDAITKLHQAGIVDGANGAFHPEAPLTRAQMAKVLVLAFHLTPGGTSTFKDVAISHWSYRYIAALEQEGIALGNDGYFNPNDPVTRAQFVAFMSRAMKS